MQRVQDRAGELFDEHGYDNVTIDAIAAATEISARTIYRYFGTKEEIVFWDDVDNDIGSELLARLGTADPVTATGDALVEVLGRLTSDEAATLLARTKLIYETPALIGAYWQKTQTELDELQEAYALFSGQPADSLQHVVDARVALAVLDAAIDTWQSADGAGRLADVVAAAFEQLG